MAGVLGVIHVNEHFSSYQTYRYLCLKEGRDKPQKEKYKEI
jgi:hypothetical protein